MKNVELRTFLGNSAQNYSRLMPFFPSGNTTPIQSLFRDRLMVPSTAKTGDFLIFLRCPGSTRLPGTSSLLSHRDRD